MPTKKKYDYDGEDFYTAIGNLAAKDYNDNEIAQSLGEEIRKIVTARNDEKIDDAKLGDDIQLEDVDSISEEGISPEVFSRMKSGTYDGWSEQENKLRSMLICQVLQRARAKLSLYYKGVYDKMALGKLKVKTTQTVEKHTVNKEGNPYTETVTTTTEQELPPNLQAITTWRFHHDPEFRKAVTQMKKMDVAIEDKGIDKISVNVVYNKKEDTELQEKK